MIIGAVINAIAILVGGTLGLLLRGRLNESFSKNIMRAIGLCVCIIGISGGLGGDIMLMVTSLALGAFVGELLRIDENLNNLGLYVQNKFNRADKNSNFAQGFSAATLLFCVGAMAIVGSIESGLRNDQSIIMAKSVLDGVSAMVLASSLGFGVLFSAVIVLLYQGGIEFFAGHLQYVFTAGLITQISAVGGAMLLGIGVNMTLDGKVKVANLLPSLLFAVGYYYLFLSN